MKTIKGCFDKFVNKLVKTDEGGEGEADFDFGNTNTGSSEVVFISGESGTGKTALAESIKNVVFRRRGIYISGKFDIQNRRDPFLGIISLFRELCGEILELRLRNKDGYEALCDAILSAVGDEIVLLTKVVPVLKEVIDIPDDMNAVAEQGNKEAKERLKYGFLQFFRVISAHFDHLVIVLDDLQWTDAMSIELLDGIIGDKDIRTMFIGIYRSNEVDEAHYLSKTIRDLHAAKEKGGFEVTEISVGNLDVSVCEEILISLLSVDPSPASSRLAEICHKRTDGNVFHLLSYLTMLQEENLLQFHLGMFKWTWNCDCIEEETAASSNVVDLILAKIAKQPQEMKYFLQLVSCLGSSFEKDVVLCALPQMRDSTACEFDMNELEDEVDELISLAIHERFLESQSDLRFCWVHDSIQEAALKQRFSESEIDTFKFKLGNALLQSLTEEDVENNLFDIVNLLTSIDECPEEDRATLLGLCLKAAKKSTELTSFDSCVIYAERGISLLPVEKWTQEREVSLELYSLITEAYLSIVNAEKMKVYANEVLHQSSLSELEKVRVHICIISLNAGVMNKAREALDMSIDVLRKLGCKFPKNKLLQARLAVSSVLGAKLPSEKDIAALSPMEDETRKACMEIMVNAATFSHHCNNIPAFIALNSRMAQWTMKYGVDVYSAPAFALFGMVKKPMSYKTAALYADRGFQLLDMCKEGKRTESRVTYISWFQIYPFSKPIHSTLKNLLRGYKVGMEVGDVESAMWNVSQYMCNSIVAGKALKPLAVDCVTYIEQMQMLKADFTYHMSLPFAQGVLNMIGDADDPLKLSGSAMIEEDFLAMIESSEGKFWSSLHLQIFKSMMCSFFGDFENGAKLALERGDVYEKKNGSPLAMTDTLHQGVSFYAMARKTKEKRYIKAAKKVKNKVVTWVKKGNVNAVHYLSFFEAEEAALEGKAESATELYPKAIISAARSGFQHDAALVSERYAEYLLHDLKENDSAGQYFQDSIQYYQGWGSDYKAEMLRKKYSYLWPDEIPKDITVNA
ncbi:putative AAA ATPase [Skeletonema marinoi]|uniref:AAA ATPase n=1 Tax=Skeletonema marinoi TaxID=267567 RepID=A0AAD9DD65_9STRA|nr:putative AAA ATPase [Skeletonema marinoi]